MFIHKNNKEFLKTNQQLVVQYKFKNVNHLTNKILLKQIYYS